MTTQEKTYVNPQGVDSTEIDYFLVKNKRQTEVFKKESSEQY